MKFDIINCKSTEMFQLSNAVLRENIEKIEFNLNTLKFCEPDGMLIFSHILEEMKKRGIVYEFSKLTEHSDAIGYARNIGFLQQIGAIESSVSKNKQGFTYLSPRKKNLNSLLQENKDINHYWDVLANKIFDVTFSKVDIENERTKKLISYSICEIFRNIRDHSCAENFQYCAQFYRKKEKFIISISDFGVGLKNTIPFDIEEKFLEKNKDIDAIKKAILPGLTAGSNLSYETGEYGNSGYGLNLVKKICEQSGGKLLIASGESAVIFSKEGEEENICYLEGTIISMHINTGNLDFNLQELVQQAEKEAAKLGMTDTASAASKKIMYI